MSERQPHHEPAKSVKRWPRRLLLTVTAIPVALVLIVALIAVLTATLLSTQSGSRWVLDRALPLVSSESLRIEHDGLDGSLLGGLVLHDPDIRMDQSRISAQRLELVWQPWSLLGGTLVFDRIHVTAPMVDWHSAEPDPDPAPGTPIGAMLDSVLPLPINLRIDHFGADAMDITVDDNPLPFRSLETGLALRAHRFSISGLILDATPIGVSGGLAITLRDSFALQSSLTWSYQTQDDTLPPLGGQLALEGDLDTVRIHHELREPATLISSGPVTLGLTGLLHDGNDMPAIDLDLQHTLENLALDDTGFAISALEGWHIDSLALHTRGTPDNLVVNGSLRMDAMRPGESDSRTTVTVPVNAQWDSRIQGSTWQLDRMQIDASDNTLLLNGRIDWSDVLSMTAEVDLDAPTPDSIYPLPGGLQLNDVRTRASVALSLPEDGLSSQVQLQELAASLNGQSLTGAGGLALQNGVLSLDGLRILSGDNRLTANGQVGDTLDALLELDIPSIRTIYPAAQGTASARLALTGSMEQPSAQARASINDFIMDDVGLRSLQLDGNMEGERLDIRVDGADLEAGGQSLQRLSASLDGTLQDHNAEMQADGTPGSLRLVVTGGIMDGGWRGVLEDSLIASDLGEWQQQEPAELSVGPDVRLAPTCWSQQDASLCLNADLAQGNLDASLALQRLPMDLFNHGQAETILRQFHEGGLPAAHYPAPDNITPPFRLPDALALTGRLDADVRANGPIADFQALQLDADASLNELALYIRQSEDSLPIPDIDEESAEPPSAGVEQILWEDASMSASLNAGEWRARMGMALYQNELAGTGVSMRGTTEAEVTLDTEGTLDGRLDLGFDDIAWLQALVPQMRDTAGRLQGSILIGGRPETPELSAELSLTEAYTRIPALGLVLEEIELQLTNPDTDRFTLNAALRSGEGTLSLDSEILRPLESDRSVQLTLQGDRFQVANTEELQASISPDLTVAGDSSGLNMNGGLHVPVLDITITELPESAVDVSADTVITTDMSGVNNTALSERGALQSIPMRGEIQLSLGDQVRFRGFGLDAGLRGALDITQRPDATPLAYGELDIVNGRFEMYGQSLQIEQGRLQFLGSYNNPALDIRAVRTVSSTRVGVQINGTARNMRSQLFSTPALPDADVLAMLITGRPLSAAGEQESPSLVGAVARLGINQGQGLTDQIRGQLGLDTLAIDAGRGGDLQDSSLTLGKYITPRIFVRYAIGLFDTENTIAIDYSLTDALKLEAQSGESQSLDLIYQMER
ncbi:MAG: translocation/assembly module TamB domain-containing protein [Pseudomonadota bacterium]